MSSASTFSSNFYGTPNDALLKHGGIPRKFHMTTDASNTFWREEVAASLTLTTGSTISVAGSTNSTQRVEFTTGSTANVEFTTVSKARVETTTDWPVTPGAGTTFNVGGNTTVSPAAGATFNIAGNATVSPAAGSTFNVAGATTAIISTASRIQAEIDALTTASRLRIESTGNLPIAGNTTAIVSTASRIQAEVDALTTASRLRIESTAPLAVSGETTALVTTASKIQVETTGAQPITGSATVSPAAGTTFQTRSLGTPQGEFTFETGTTALSTFVSKVSSVAGTTELVSSGAGRVRVLSYAIQQGDPSTVPQLVQFLSSGNALTGAPEWLLGQREGVVEPAVPGGYLFQTSTGEALQITLSTNVKTMVRATFLRTS